MKDKRIFISLFLLSITAPAIIYAGFRFGIPSIIKEKSKKMDEKVEEKKLKDDDHINQAPNKPTTLNGPSTGSVDTAYTFSTSATDPDGDKVQYRFNWDNGNISEWSSLVDSGNSISKSYSYSSSGIYYIASQARDTEGKTSAWSDTHEISINTTVSISPQEHARICDATPETRYIYNPCCQNYFVGYRWDDAVDYWISRVYMIWDLSSIPASATIEKALLRIDYFWPSTVNSQGSEDPAQSIGVHKVLSPWTSSGVCWSVQPTFKASYEYAVPVYLVSEDWPYESLGHRDWDLTTMVQRWHNGTDTNYGVVIKSENESLNALVQCDTPFTLKVTYVQSQ